MAASLCNTVYVFTGLRNISVEVDEIVHGTPLCSRSSISSSDDYRLWSIATLRFSTFWTRVAFYIYVHRSVPGGVKNSERLAILVIMFFFFLRARDLFNGVQGIVRGCSNDGSFPFRWRYRNCIASVWFRYFIIYNIIEIYYVLYNLLSNRYL